jgi:hypothetical protein
MRVSFLTPRLPPQACGLADHTKLFVQAMATQGACFGVIHCEPLQEGGDLPARPVDHWNVGVMPLRICIARQAPDWLWVQLSNLRLLAMGSTPIASGAHS